MVFPIAAQVTLELPKRVVSFDSLIALQLVMITGASGVQFGLYLYEWLTKSDDRAAAVWFVNHSYDYRPNWTKRSPATN